jgi:ribosome-binding factor A
MSAFLRSRRIGDQIHKDLADLISRELKDPRLGMITVTAVEVTNDYSHAKIYVSSLQGNEVLARSLEALQDAAGFLRNQLGKRLSIRTLPALHFVADVSLDRAIALTTLIDEAVASDDQHPKS